MDNVIAYYTENFKNIEGTIFEIFSKFYSTDLTLINSWLENQFRVKVIKNNSISTAHRTHGNALYARKDLLNSLEYYTKSLCFATHYSAEYGLALANRSAVTYKLGEFRQSLKDIELCFKTNYPIELRPKIYIRKAECYFELEEKDLLQQAICEFSKFLNEEVTIPLSGLEKYIGKLKRLEKVKCASISGFTDVFNHADYSIPEFMEGENKCFSFASPKIRMSYNKLQGRYVTANTDIQRGELLFIEKAFVSAPVFKTHKEFYIFKCFNCLKDVINSVPCKYCTICTYCDERCRDLSWREYHKWECSGMQANIWYELGIAFPAFRAMIKGAYCGFSIIDSNYEEDVKCFGDKKDNYKYFNRLHSNIYKNINVAPYVVMAATVVSYLEKYTNFFTWLLKQPKCPEENLESLTKYIGGRITKHIAQLACNSSTIEHWSSSSSELLVPDELATIACGIFPSVSIMNHSCKPNVTNYFICDTIIVKALEDIPQGHEIFNCYGFDYRVMNREERQYGCKRLYHFECKCSVCSDPTNEVEILDSYLCLKCKGPIPNNTNKNESNCRDCGQNYNLTTFRKLSAQTMSVEKVSWKELDVLLESLKVRKSFLYKHHKDFEEVYYKLYSYYVDQGDAENMFKYFQLWLDNEKARRGNSSRGIGIKQYEAALAILHCLQNGQPKNCPNLKAFLQNVEYLIKEAKIILNLYYPPVFTNKLSQKIKIVSTK